MIDRRNILELIGKHRSKYHSCILTCYSFDFSFFEERVLPTLRMADIKNVNILADGHYLEKAQEATTGKEFRHNRTYNFLPIYETGVFHPKIMLLTGKSHGLLIIGSGNITSSGLNTNDEIWGAFHLNAIDNENAPLFGAVWQYLQPFLKQSLGFVSQKIEWIREFYPWLAEFPTTDSWINIASLGLQLKFIANTNQKSTYNQLLENVPKDNVEALTIVSPYYDKSGQQVMHLKNHFTPKKLNCIVDPNSGLLPTNMLSDGIEFYRWADCKKDYEENYNRLHAKFIHFQNKEEEYLLLGSSNATMAGLGTADNYAANAEAGILIRRNLKTKNWLEELKVKIPTTPIQLSEQVSQGIEPNSIPRANYLYRLLYVQLGGREITIYSNKAFIEIPEVIVLDRNDNPLENKVVNVDGNTVVVQIIDSDSIFKVYLENNKKEQISNFCIVHRLESLVRCNPDPKQEKLNALFDQDYPDGDGITELLRYVEYDFADAETTGIPRVYDKSSAMVRVADDKKKTKDYIKLDATEFNKIEAEAFLIQSGELSNATVKIAEFLNAFIAGAFGKDDDFEESSEQNLLDDKEGDGKGEDVDRKSQKRTDGAKEKTALRRYFKKLDTIYSKELSTFFKTKALTESPKEPITIRSLSGILIGLQLIQLKYGKKFKERTKDVDREGNIIIREESFILRGTMDGSVDSVKGFLMNVLGKFLLLSSAEYKDYEYELVNQKLANSQNHLLVKSVCLILNLIWRRSERKQRDTLLLNCLYFTVGDQLLNKEVATNFIKQIEEYPIQANYVIPEFNKNLEEFKNEILPNYLQWLGNYIDQENGRKQLFYPTAKLKYGNIIFRNELGFNVVNKVTLDPPIHRLSLMRAGYPFKKGEFLLADIQVGLNTILYK